MPLRPEDWPPPEVVRVRFEFAQATVDDESTTVDLPDSGWKIVHVEPATTPAGYHAWTVLFARPRSAPPAVTFAFNGRGTLTGTSRE